jgi:hypothetical protein
LFVLSHGTVSISTVSLLAGNPSGATGISWDVNSLLRLKIESATSPLYRDDLQLMTSNVFFGVPDGLALVPGTYQWLRQQRHDPLRQQRELRFNTALSNLAPGALINASNILLGLTTASDHLPVVADFTIPVPGSNLRLGSPILTAGTSFRFAVSNADGSVITSDEQSVSEFTSRPTVCRPRPVGRS